MLNYKLLPNLLSNFKKTFSKELRKTKTEEYGNVFFVNRAIVRDIAIFLHENGANFINIVIHDLDGKFEVVYQYHLKFLEEKYWYIVTEVDKKANEIDSIEIIFPQAKFVEKEIEKRYGLKFISFTEDITEELFTMPFTLEAEGKESNISPLGVYNKIHNNNHYFHLKVENDLISAVIEKTGWLYRGVVPLMAKKQFLRENTQLTRKICYNSSYHHSLAYIMGIEALAKIKIQDKVKLLRTIFCEIERLESHLIWFANLFYLIGYKRTYYSLLRFKNSLQTILDKYLEKPNIDQMNEIGMHYDIVKKDLPLFLEEMEKLSETIFEQLYDFTYRGYTKSRCEGIGILSRAEAEEAGVSGSCLRASGISYDIRYEKPYLAYLDRDISQVIDVTTFHEGDVFARTETRLWEVQNSTKIILLSLEKLIESEEYIKLFDPTKIRLAADERVIIQVESPQGELLYYLRTADRPNKPTLGGVFIATPSLKNFFALNNYILKGNQIKDFPLIVHSMDLNFNCIDL